MTVPCRRDPDAWFAEKASAMAEAARACRSCPAREACLRTALAWESGLGARYRFGIWGGLTPRQRAALAEDAPDENDPSAPTGRVA
jgi:WhiB family transcriptional regulator, redox-sensing transcriptional regulator